MTNKPVIFEEIKRTNEYQSEYWSARQLAKALEYKDYRNFETVLKKAKEACKNSGQSVKDHFGDVTDMIEVGKTASREITDTHLSRYACYLVVQNADPSKGIVALGQTYFAIQTRKQEVQEQLIEDQKRLFLRGEVTTHNKHLAETASKAGVKNYGVFTNYGYMGLYGGRKVQDIHKQKKLKKSQKILDHMGSEELAANLFRATQTDAKIKREEIQGEARANQAHHNVGKKVRETIKELGGAMPEQLPTPDGVGRAKTRAKKLAAQKRKELGE
ncbi:DNA damage-inducible protein D [Patescibacteria group bacterium]|nr:DNA damage-inducible protein D [Patescibacteria group bacterium]